MRSKVKAVASGSGAGWPIAPAAQWDSVELPYPAGTADLEALSGQPLDLGAFLAVPQYLYVGDQDANDPVPGWPAAERDAVFALTGVTSGPIWPRWPVAQEVYDSLGSASEFAIYSDAGHVLSIDMVADVESFFLENVPEPASLGLSGTSLGAVLLLVRLRKDGSLA